MVEPLGISYMSLIAKLDVIVQCSQKAGRGLGGKHPVSGRSLRVLGNDTCNTYLVMPKSLFVA